MDQGRTLALDGLVIFAQRGGEFGAGNGGRLSSGKVGGIYWNASQP
jgi:hypothetical protein